MAGRFDDPDQAVHICGVICSVFYERVALFMQEEPASLVKRQTGGLRNSQCVH